MPDMPIKSGSFQFLEMPEAELPSTVAEGLREATEGSGVKYEPLLYVGVQLLDYGMNHTLICVKTPASGVPEKSLAKVVLRADSPGGVPNQMVSCDAIQCGEEI